MDRTKDNLAGHIAEAASALPELIQRRDKLQLEVNQLNQKVNALISYIGAFLEPGAPPVVITLANGSHLQIGASGMTPTGPTGPQIPANIPANIRALMAAAMGQVAQPAAAAGTAPAPTQPSATQSGRAPKGQVYDHVDALLTQGGKYTLKGLRDALSERFGHGYGPSSIHRALVKGVREKRYKVNGSYEYFKA